MSKELKIGDRVRDEDGEKGTIIRLGDNSIFVRFDNEDEDSDIDFVATDLDLITPEDSQLAEEFSQLCKSVHKEIDDKISQAAVLLREAVEISEKNGVPFSSQVSFLGNSFVPGSFSKSKFAKLDTNQVCEIAGVYGEYIRDMFGGYGNGSWVHSGVC